MNMNKKNSLEIQKKKDFVAIFSMKKSWQKQHKENSVKDNEQSKNTIID